MNESRPLLRSAPAPGKRLSLVLAIAVHVLLAGFLIYGVHWQTRAPEAVEVELVSAIPAPSAVPPAPTFEPEPAPPSPPKPEPKPEPKLEPRPEPKPLPPPPKPDIALKEPKQKPPPKVVPREIPKEIPKEIPRPDPFKEQLKRETERLDKSKLAAALDKEVAGAKSAQAAAAAKKSSDEWGARIRGKIRGNIVLPPDIKGNPEAEFLVTLLPSGEVLNLRLTKSSGNPALDAAIERAIRKSDPLPKPEQGEVFQRELVLKYRPRED